MPALFYLFLRSLSALRLISISFQVPQCYYFCRHLAACLFLSIPFVFAGVLSSPAAHFVFCTRDKTLVARQNWSYMEINVFL
uniref:Uncharacterized protein n=1 Tax=Arundo donax TaxID=35708 RepID=A0A0A9BEA1_ARUDO